FAWVDGHADLWHFFYEPELLASIVSELAKPFEGKGVTKVVGIESKGFILGGAVAIRLNAGFAAIRKPGGLFPGEKLEVSTAKDYRGIYNTLKLQRASLDSHDKVVLVDDWFEKGSQALGAKKLIKASGATYLGSSIIVDQLSDKARNNIGNVHSIINAHDLGDSRSSL
ncbi:MAG TPA: hypothetical protein VMR98_03735, partial [Candidatus Polarisedimenticolaceae bacterium]|nr:hypothetical protein [Candidatus Polarisedimenticolaceae bacterium]